MSAFTDLFKRCLANAGLNQNQFVVKGGFNSGTVSKVYRDLIPPPEGCGPAWAKVLGLTGDERERFIEACEIAKALHQKRAGDGLRRIWENLEEANARIEALETAVVLLVDLYQKAGRKVPNDILQLTKSIKVSP